MMASDGSGSDAGVVCRVIDPRVVSAPDWEDIQTEPLAEYQDDLASQRWDDELQGSREILAHEALVAQAVEDETLGAALAGQQFAPLPTAARLPRDELTPLGCSSVVTTPPFPIGFPRTEESGPAATIVETGAAPNALFSLPGASAMPTFTQLADPDEGALSLGVALGKLRLSGTAYSMHPASVEGPGALAYGEMTFARGGLGYVAVPSGAPLVHGNRMNVLADLTIGSGPKPYYLLVPPVLGPPSEAWTRAATLTSCS